MTLYYICYCLNTIVFLCKVQFDLCQIIGHTSLFLVVLIQNVLNEVLLRPHTLLSLLSYSKNWLCVLVCVCVCVRACVCACVFVRVCVPWWCSGFKSHQG